MTHRDCLFRVVVLAVLSWFTTPTWGGAEEALSPEAVSLLEHLEPLWEGMKSDIASCDIEYQLFLQVKANGQWPREQVLTALNRYDLAAGPDQIASLFQELGTKTKPIAGVRHLQRQGRQERYSMGDKTVLKDDTLSLVSVPQSQLIRVLDRGREDEGYFTVEYFRTPSKTRAEGLLPASVERSGDRVTIGTRVIARDGVVIQTLVEFDWVTGVALRRQSSREGVVYREVLYSSITTFPGSLTIPRVVTTLNYGEGLLKSLDLAVLGSAQFNTPLPKEVFELAKAADWVALDFRGNAAGARVHVPPEEVADIRTLIPAQPLDPAMVAGMKLVEESSPWRRVLLGINGIVLIGVAIWFWRRAGTQESTR